MAYQTLYKNLDRKSNTINRVQLLKNGSPAPTWIDVNTKSTVIENVFFVPRSNPDTYPNIKNMV